MRGSGKRIFNKTSRLQSAAAVIYVFLFAAMLAGAAPAIAFSVAKTIPVADPEVAYGDVILFEKETGLYRLSQSPDDPRFFGIVVEDPALLVETDSDLVPVIKSGLIPVNVVLENGAIEIGDPLITSSVPGKAMRAGEDHMNVFGFAMEPLGEEDGVARTTEDGGNVVLGTIMAEVGGSRLETYLAESKTSATTDAESLSEAEKLSNATIARYALAGVVALGSLYVTFYTFLSSIRSGVTSVGRNPRAKASIHSMVVVNVVLALVVTAVGIFFAISLLVLPSS